VLATTATTLAETVAQSCGFHVHSSFWKLIPQVGDAFSMGVSLKKIPRAIADVKMIAAAIVVMLLCP
jgi:hypothetical protein